MAGKTITQRIALSGGQEIEVQLKNLGEAGATAFKRIKDSADTTAQTLPRVAANFDALKKKFEEVQASATNFNRRIGDAGNATREFGQHLAYLSVAAVGVAIGFSALVLKAANAAEAIANGAEAAQLSTDKYQDLQAAFQVSGVGADALDTAVSRLNRSFGTSKTESLNLQKSQNDLTKEYLSGKISATAYNDQLQKLQTNARTNVDVFNRLGVSFQSVGGDTGEGLKQIAARLLEMPKGIERASLELQVFGRSGTKLEPVLKEMAGIGDATTGLVKKLSPLEVAVGKELTEAFRKLQINIDRTYDHLYLAFGPGVARLISTFSQVIISNEGAFANLAKVIEAETYPILKDLILLMSDGSSAIQKGGVVDIILTGLKNVYAAVKIVVEGFIIGFKLISATLQPVADLINKVFGTQVTGEIILIVAAVLQFTGALKLLFSLVQVGVAGFQLLSGIIGLAFAPGGVFIIGIGLIIAAVALLALTHLPELKAAFTAVYDFMSDGIKSLVEFWDKLNATIDSGIDALKRFLGLQQAQTQANNSGGGVGFAGGGHVNGPGSGTSDSIIARLSNGEFVQRAQAVAYYGPAFMAALNQMRIPRNIVEGLAGFANGGFVRAIGSLAPMPRFATGGLVDTKLVGGANGHPVTLNIGGEIFTGLVAEDKTFDRLQRFAVRRNIQSPGHKPQWVT